MFVAAQGRGDSPGRGVLTGVPDAVAVEVVLHRVGVLRAVVELVGDGVAVPGDVQQRGRCCLGTGFVRDPDPNVPADLLRVVVQDVSVAGGCVKGAVTVEIPFEPGDPPREGRLARASSIRFSPIFPTYGPCSVAVGESGVSVVERAAVRFDGSCMSLAIRRCPARFGWYQSVLEPDRGPLIPPFCPWSPEVSRNSLIQRCLFLVNTRGSGSCPSKASATSSMNFTRPGKSFPSSSMIRRCSLIAARPSSLTPRAAS